MLVSVSSVSLGVVMALSYQFFALRSQVRFAKDPGAAQGLLFVAEMLLRFAWVGAVLAALHRWTPLDVTVAAVGFVGAFVILQGFTLYRYAAGHGPFELPALRRRAAREGEGTSQAGTPAQPGDDECALEGATCW
jgi:hypothetical protein